MPKHHSEDYKISAVKHYLNKTKNLTKTCEEFDCSRISLKRWVNKYEKDKSIKRYSRKELSYKITKEQVKYAITLLKKNQQITMTELVKLVKKKYKDFGITSQHLGKVLKDNNKTRKRTRHEHFPITRYKKPINKKEELVKFYKEVSKYKLNNIISLDETSISPAMIAEYSRCESGKRCVVKTDDSFFFRKFTLLVAIKNSKCIGWILYEKGGMTKERLVEFMNTFIFNKYKKHLIILDNAGSHRNNFVKVAITNSGNKYLFSIPYTPKTNAIENLFNQLKYYLKLNKKVLKFNEIKQEIKKAFTKIKKQHYKNYFLYAYNKDKLTLPKKSTRKRKDKKYKD
jgi:transposase-like protein/transposase